MAENRAKHRARFDRGQGHPGTPFPSLPLQRSKTEPDMPMSLRGTGFGGSVLRGNSEEKIKWFLLLFSTLAFLPSCSFS